jgi:hypothetical protein
MDTIIGIFGSITAAEQAAVESMESGVPERALTLLSNQTPNRADVKRTSEHDVEHAPTTEIKNEGSGRDMGAQLGAWIGGSAGFAAGATAATLMVPGLGAIFAIGAGAAALLGLGGAAAGAKVGDVSEKEASSGIDKNDAEFYRQVLRSGRSVLIASVDTNDLAVRTREIFRLQGGEEPASTRQDLRRSA